MVIQCMSRILQSFFFSETWAAIAELKYPSALQSTAQYGLELPSELYVLIENATPTTAAVLESQPIAAKPGDFRTRLEKMKLKRI
ncbi:hypothetical protein KIN20_022826 [Parelaphostrongylus tenuis]|uniref:Uncharacterized protein n=1 Tax=Parelaphostrongylus tenuis TaxID=148309 RepID=A0AAD5N8D8_PARTN|nr:hypothetical protein KIN20_022826 [Parelaphostrongylus tenuis]